MHAAQARPAALAALRASRFTFPASVVDHPASSSATLAFPRVAALTARLNGDRGPSAP
jgi:hypothetical protein